jgi:hypothetical protein
MFGEDAGWDVAAVMSSPPPVEVVDAESRYRSAAWYYLPLLQLMTFALDHRNGNA